MAHIQPRAARHICIALLSGASFFSTSAFAVDVNPYDWMPAPNGTNAFIVYGPWSHSDKAVVNGTKLDASLNTALVMPRMTHYFEIDNHPAVVSALLPMGRLWKGSLAGMDLGSRTAVGDLFLAAGYWVISNSKERRQLAIAGYLNVPLGSYDRDKNLNLSTGSPNATLQVGNMVAISDKLTLETTGDATFYRRNTNSNPQGQTLRQDNSYSIQNWISYSLSETTTLSIGHTASFGGTQYLNDTANGFNSKKQQVKFGANHWLTPTISIYGQINQDIDVKGGFKGVSGMVRLAKIF